jgi:hypothetical protein
MAAPERLTGLPVPEREGRRSMPTKSAPAFRAGIVAIAPAVMVAAFASHPYIGLGPPNAAAVAEAAASNTTLWGVSHLLLAASSGLLAVAFLAIRSYLREAGEERWSALGLPFVLMACTLYAALPGMEFAALAAAETGADVRAAQSAVEPWFIPTLLTSAVLFSVGAILFARGTASIGLSSPGLTRVVVVGLVVLAVARLIPLNAVQFYVQSAALLVALWPLAYVIWRHSKAGPSGRPRHFPAA